MEIPRTPWSGRPLVQVLVCFDDTLTLLAPHITNDVHICKASCSTLLWAAVRNVRDECGVIVAKVIVAMEFLIANWRRRRIAIAAWRNLVINVQMLGAAIFSCTVLATTTVPCEHLSTIGVIFEMTISEVVLIMMRTRSMTSNPHSLIVTLLPTSIRHGIIVTGKGHRMDFGPLSLMVNLDANGVTMLVILLSGNIDAFFSATLGEKLFLGVFVQEYVNIAFDLLGCRPINLAVLLEALRFRDDNLISVPAADLALLEFDRA